MNLRDSAAAILKEAQVIFADSIFLAQLDGAQLALANPVPYGNDLYTVAFCHFGAGVQLTISLLLHL